MFERKQEALDFTLEVESRASVLQVIVSEKLLVQIYDINIAKTLMVNAY